MSGRRKRTAIIDKKTTRKDRNPLDTPKPLHELMDDFFYKKFGVKSRSNAIFCSFNPNLVDDFGTTHLIFPIGKYKAVSSDYIEDIYNRIDIIFKMITGGGISVRRFAAVDEEDLEWLKREILTLLKDSSYTDKLIFHNNEIMVTCKEYYIVNKDFNGPLLDAFGE
jgi:hypothetical protein